VNTENEKLFGNGAVFDEDGSFWSKMENYLTANYRHIIALRGAGSYNGIDPTAANQILSEQLIPRIRAYLETGNIAIIYDGDEDILLKPDIGYVMGCLRDVFALFSENAIGFFAVQKKSWYYPVKSDGNIANASGLEYATVVFSDGKFEGDHDAFSQSEKLVNFFGYEQWYVGASGNIASQQLQDFNKKIAGGKRKAVIFRALINEYVSEEIEAKLEKARVAKDDVKITRFEGAIEQRKNKKYGAHFDNAGNFIVDCDTHPNLSFEVV